MTDGSVYILIAKLLFSLFIVFKYILTLELLLIERVVDYAPFIDLLLLFNSFNIKFLSILDFSIFYS